MANREFPLQNMSSNTKNPILEDLCLLGRQAGKMQSTNEGVPIQIQVKGNVLVLASVTLHFLRSRNATPSTSFTFPKRFKGGIWDSNVKVSRLAFLLTYHN